MTTIDYTPLPSIARFHESRARVKVLWGPLGCGKTSGALWEFVLACMESEIPLDGMVIRSSYRELRDTTLKTFLTWFGEISSWSESDSLARVRLPAPDGKTTLEHVLRFRSMERPEDTKKVASWEGAFVMIDEAVPAFSSATLRMNDGIPLDIVEYTNARLRHTWRGREAHRYTQVIVANPPPPSHWLYKHFIAKDPEELASRRGGVTIHFVPKDENEGNLPTDYYAYLCDIFHDPDMVRRFVEGEIVTTYSGEAVFPEVRQREHIVDTRLRPIEGVPLVCGWDFGLTPATLVTQLTPTGQWRWLSEVQNFNCSFDTHLELVRIHMHENYLGFKHRSWGDPLGGIQRAQTDERTCVEMAAKAGFDIGPGRIDWQSRKEAIKQRLLRRDAVGEPALIVSRPGCPLSAEALCGAYRYPKSASGEIGTRPIKNHVSHLMDSGQAIATKEFDINPQGLPRENVVVFGPNRPLDPFRPVKMPPKKRSSWLSR